jgi:urease accessory protein
MRPDILLRLLQLCDAGFPTGGYAFSHGLEGLHALGLIRDETDVTAFARDQIEETLAGIELPAVRRAHRTGATGDVAGLCELDALLDALKPVPAFRSGSVRVGRRFLESAAPLLDDPRVAAYLAAVRRDEAVGYHAVAFGAVLAAAGIEEEAAALAFGAVALNGYLAASVRLGIIGQQAAQRIVGTLQPSLIEAAERARHLLPDDWGAYMPLADLAGLRQEALRGRLFAS